MISLKALFQEKVSWEENLYTEKVSGKSSLTCKGFLGSEISEKGFLKNVLFLEVVYGRRNLCLLKFQERVFQIAQN